MLSKSDLKRKLILDTTSEFITENGIHAVTLDAIAKKAGISKGGYYIIFQIKNLY